MRSNDIRQTREKLGLNQVEFAYIAGVHPITVSKWERGASAPTPYHNALFEQFGEAAKDREICLTIRNILIAAGVAVALALLLKHLLKK